MITEKLAHYIDNTEYNDFKSEVIEKAKLCFLDFLGVSIAGSRTKSGRIMRNIISSRGPSSVIGGSKTSASEASLINGVSAHCLDLDDGHRVVQMAEMKVETGFPFQMRDSLPVIGGGPADHPVNLVAPGKQKFRKIGAILPRDAGD